MVDKTEKSAGKASLQIENGDTYRCEVCGLQVNVDICGEFLSSRRLYYCGKPMKTEKKLTD